MSDWRARALRPLRRVASRSGVNAHEESPERSMDPRGADHHDGPVEDAVIDNAVYVDGRRARSPASLSETFEQLRLTPGSMAWIEEAAADIASGQAELLPHDEVKRLLATRREHGRDPLAQLG